MADTTQKNDNFIQLKKDNILRIGIKDAEGNDTGEHLEFDLEDVEYPLKLNQCESEHNKNIRDLQMQYKIIDKKQDKKGKKILSWKEEEKIKALQEFYKREMATIDLFLGEGGCKKLLNGRKPYYSMYDDIGEIIKPILPKLKMRTDDIKNKIMEKYKNRNEESNVLK